jgi:uracil-DNA glycosylase family 4
MPNSDLAELIADVKEQVLYLQELGVKALAVDVLEVSARAKVQTPKAVEAKAVIPDLKPEITRPKSTGSRISSLPSLKERTTGAPARVVHMVQGGAPETEAQSPTISTISPESPTTMETTVIETIESIRADIGDCTRCKLHTGRKQIVHTTGNFSAELMFVGEAPGADEDEQGFPFVGRAGQLLTKIIESIGMTREEVCIGNINRCRPPGNRQPEPDETAQCRPFILREVAVVKPKAIVVLGATAAHNLLQVKTPISKLRGNFQDYFGVKVMPTFHPAYLLRDPHKKREVWDDMKMVRDYLNAN